MAINLKTQMPWEDRPVGCSVIRKIRLSDVIKFHRRIVFLIVQ